MSGPVELPTPVLPRELAALVPHLETYLERCLEEIRTAINGEAPPQVTLPAAATSFEASGDFLEITGDAGTNTIATITGGRPGQVLRLLFVDALVTITDDNTHAADSVDLSAAFTSADDTTLSLIYDGTSWYELSRSVN